MDVLDRDAVALAYPLAQFERFGELITGFEVDDRDPRLDLGEHVDHATPLGPERGRHQQSRMELSHGLPEDFLWGRARQFPVRAREFFHSEPGCHHPPPPSNSTIPYRHRRD